MEAVVDVALPVSPDPQMVIGSPDGSDGGISGSVSGILARDSWSTQVARGRKDDSIDNTTLVSTSFQKSHGSKLYVEGGPPCSMASDAILNDLSSPKRNSFPCEDLDGKCFPCKDLDGKCLPEKSSKQVRNNVGGAKRSRVVQEESSKRTTESHSVDGSSRDFPSSSKSCILSGKNQNLKQRNNLASGRGDKKSMKVKCKNRSDSSFLKNGFCSSLGGTYFSGMYGHTPGVLDITKYVEELSLDELLKGNYTYTRISEKKGKCAADSNAIVLDSVQNACSILRAQKVLRLENSVDLETAGVQDVSAGLPLDNSEVGQTDEATEGKQHMDPMTCDKDQDPDGKIKILKGIDPPLRDPRDVLNHLVLPQPTVSDLLLCDRSKHSSSKNSHDPRTVKMAPYQCGLPPFPWSHSFSGHNKLGFDAFKLFACRAVCQGKWVNAKHSAAFWKDSTDLLVNIESLTFNDSLVPPVSSISEQPEDQIVATGQLLCSSVANSSLEAHGDENFPEYTAAHTLLHIAAHSKDDPPGKLKLSRHSSQISMKARKLNAMPRTNKVIVDSKSKTKQSNPVKTEGDGFPLKKARVSTDVANGYIPHDEPLRKGFAHRSASSVFKPRHKKLFMDSNVDANIYGSNVIKRTSIKPRQIKEWPNGNRKKFWRSAA